MDARFDAPFWVGERYFAEADIALMHTTITQCQGLSRGELVSTLCEILPWKSPTGQLRRGACHGLLDDWEARGVELPPKRTHAPTPRPEHQGTPVPLLTVRTTLAALQPVQVVPVRDADRLAWNATMATYHPLGFRRICGTRQAYWILSTTEASPRILGGILFATAAKALRDRDTWIGWDPALRARFRARIVSNSRFLILPSIQVTNLASHVLRLAAQRLPADWTARYGFAPVLVETFVEAPWRGTVYAAANWTQVGETTGRGRNDRHKTATLPRKTIWMYPLIRQWPRALLTPWPVGMDAEEGFDD